VTDEPEIFSGWRELPLQEDVFRPGKLHSFFSSRELTFNKRFLFW
jgi:hypothetical protein